MKEALERRILWLGQISASMSDEEVISAFRHRLGRLRWKYSHCVMTKEKREKKLQQARAEMEALGDRAFRAPLGRIERVGDRNVLVRHSEPESEPWPPASEDNEEATREENAIRSAMVKDHLAACDAQWDDLNLCLAQSAWDIARLAQREGFDRAQVTLADSLVLAMGKRLILEPTEEAYQLAGQVDLIVEQLIHRPTQADRLSTHRGNLPPRGADIGPQGDEPINQHDLIAQKVAAEMLGKKPSELSDWLRKVRDKRWVHPHWKGSTERFHYLLFQVGSGMLIRSRLIELAHWHASIKRPASGTTTATKRKR